MIMKNRIETPRLLLRPFMESDLPAFFACCRNPNIGDNAGWKPHETLEESEQILHSIFMEQENIWAILLKEENQLIGSIGLIHDPARENPYSRMLGYWLDELFWGNGYMSEAVRSVLKYAFEELQMDLVTANCYPHNSRSLHILKCNGFVYEGTLHQAEQIYNGQIYDHLCYYLTRDMYKTQSDKFVELKEK